MSATLARLFIAIDLPASVRTELHQWGRSAAAITRSTGGKLRLLDAQALHVTMCFLGNCPVAEIEPLRDAIRAVADSAEAGEVSLGAPLWLPPRRPRVLAVEIHDDEGALTDLHGELQISLGAICGLESEHRRFHPHVTVARMGRRDAPGERALTPTPALSFLPRTLVLYRSWLSPQGSSYEPLERAALAGKRCSSAALDDG